MKMKPLFAALLSCMIVFTACKTTPKDLVAKKWKPTDISTPGMTADMKSKFLAGDNSVEFNKDGKYTTSTDGKSDDQGTYTLSEDGKTITLNSSTKGSQTIMVNELTKDRMVGNMMGATITFVPYNK